MNYKKIYIRLIKKRISNPIKIGYRENHHILPKALGGDNSKDNIVALTGREHWIAHLLLHKIHRSPKTAYACHMMAMRCDERGIPKIRNSRMYEWVRIQCVKHWSKNGKKRIGEKNGSYGTMWICNIELKQNKKIKTDEDIPDGWIKGRNKWNEIIRFKPETRECSECNESFITKTNRGTFCSRICKNKYTFKHAKEVEIVRDGVKKYIKHQNLNAYKKIGWKLIK